MNVTDQARDLRPEEVRNEEFLRFFHAYGNRDNGKDDGSKILPRRSAKPPKHLRQSHRHFPVLTKGER